jgi:hypothetical protein
MNTSEKIFKFFETYNTQHFLQFPPGAGGEFIAKTVIEYSQRYKKTESYMDLESNRTTVVIPKLYKLLASAEVNLLTLSILSNSLAKDSDMHGHDIDAIIKEAEEYNDYGNALNLIRIHHSTCEIFNKENTFSIVPDNDKWTAYCNILRGIKALGKELEPIEVVPVYINEFRRGRNASKLGFTEKFYEDAIEWVLTKRPKVLHGHIFCLAYIEEIGSFDNLFAMTIQDIISFLKDKPANGTFNILRMKYDFLKPLTERYNTIYMSKMFDDDYVAEIFDISNPEINKTLQDWHNTNLKLIASYGIDLENFKL